MILFACKQILCRLRIGVAVIYKKCSQNNQKMELKFYNAYFCVLTDKLRSDILHKASSSRDWFFFVRSTGDCGFYFVPGAFANNHKTEKEFIIIINCPYTRTYTEFCLLKGGET